MEFYDLIEKKFPDQGEKVARLGNCATPVGGVVRQAIKEAGAADYLPERDAFFRRLFAVLRRRGFCRQCSALTTAVLLAGFERLL